MLGIGSIVEKVCDAVGLPEEVGDIAGMVTDFHTGNWIGMTENAMDLAENAGLKLEGPLPELTESALALTTEDSMESVTLDIIAAGLRG